MRFTVAGSFDFAGCSVGGNLAALQDDDAVGELIGFFQIVGGQAERFCPTNGERESAPTCRGGIRCRVR